MMRRMSQITLKIQEFRISIVQKFKSSKARAPAGLAQSCAQAGEGLVREALARGVDTKDELELADDDQDATCVSISIIQDCHLH
jgi:hypothetical protein